MKIIDLSSLIHSGMEVFPGDPEVNIDLVHTYEKNTWQLRNISMGTHTGSHVDSYSHMHKGKKSIDQISLESFFGESQVVEISKEWPRQVGLFFTDDIAIDLLDKIIGADPSFVGGNMSEELERALLKADIITYTGLVNLDLIPKMQSFMFYGLPLKIKQADGSPVRAMAIINI